VGAGCGGLDAKSGGKRGVGAVLGGSADFEGLAFKNLQIAFKWLFLFGSGALKPLWIAGFLHCLGFRKWCKKCCMGFCMQHFRQQIDVTLIFQFASCCYVILQVLQGARNFYNLNCRMTSPNSSGDRSPKLCTLKRS